ncbi:MAG: DNA gyrase subunit A [Clostridiales bacterium]|nr:DNA gyrase subunit A [Clostridiales bacterium]
MARRKKNDIVINETIIPQSLEDVMHSSMMPYAEYVVMERALPRVEDGLKPVQRRILYTMMELANTPDKPHKKSARIAGDTMGKYHPHGDTSIYDAMVRMAQDFSMRGILVDGHGNFGSVDGDRAAAMRYTEVRLAPLAMELLRDIDKDTVPFALNFDDTLKEPVLLPGRFPNLLVNGAVGIAVGLATNIPTHNLGEIIDATVAMIDKPSITLDELMKLVPGPDFPTGGSILETQGIREGYETGRGRICIRARCAVEKAAAGKSLIVITEIPYQVNKAAMLEKILKLCEDKKGILAGISDIRDESDREGMRAVIEVKKDADAEKILQYLYKYSDLQVGYGINMVAIADGKPRQMGLKAILEHYIRHQLEVVTRRIRFDLERAEAREHILEGLLIAIRNIDEVIALIKSSASVPEAKKRLMSRFKLTGVQAQAILDMRLQRLTALEVEKLEKELAEVRSLIAELRAILASKQKLRGVVKKELLDIKKKYADARRTRILDDNKIVEFNAEDFVIVEDVVVTVSREGYAKRLPQKTYSRSDRQAFPDDLSPADSIMAVMPGTTAYTLYVFTGDGNMYQLPVSQIPESRWASRGAHLSTLLKSFSKSTHIAGAICADRLPVKGELLFVTRGGMAKRTALDQYDTRSRKYAACGVREGDEVLHVGLCQRGLAPTFFTRKGMALQLNYSQISQMGRTARGVQVMTLDDGDEMIYVCHSDGEGEFVALTDRGYGKRLLTLDFSPGRNRAVKGTKIFTFMKNGSNGEAVVFVDRVKEPADIVVLQKSGAVTRISSEEFPIETPGGKGAPLVPVVLGDDPVRVFLHMT